MRLIHWVFLGIVVIGSAQSSYDPTIFQVSTFETTASGATTVTFSYVLNQTTQWSPCNVGDYGACVVPPTVTTVVETITVTANHGPSASDILYAGIMVALLAVAIAYVVRTGKHRRIIQA
jgi:hypothetical protein